MRWRAERPAAAGGCSAKDAAGGCSGKDAAPPRSGDNGVARTHVNREDDGVPLVQPGAQPHQPRAKPDDDVVGASDLRLVLRQPLAAERKVDAHGRRELRMTRERGRVKTGGRAWGSRGAGPYDDASGLRMRHAQGRRAARASGLSHAAKKKRRTVAHTPRPIKAKVPPMRMPATDIGTRYESSQAPAARTGRTDALNGDAGRARC